MRNSALYRIGCLVLMLCILAGCGMQNTPSGKKEETIVPAEAASEPASPAPEESPAVVIVTPTPTPEQTVVIVTPSPSPAPTPSPTPTPTPTPKADIPVITKNPGSVTVAEGSACYFEADYVNAIWAVWHFVSPDGGTDMTYEKAIKVFPSVQIVDGMYSTMKLSNVSYNMNGWKVYCRYSNNNGYADTTKATITVVRSSGGSTSNLPEVTKNPVSVTVNEGGSATFGADYVNATFAVWHFVSPDSTIDLPYDTFAKTYPTVKVTDGMYSTMTVSNIPAAMNGWKVYCRYSNTYGYTDTAIAVITVAGAPAPAPSTGYTGEYVEKIAKRATVTISGAGEYTVKVHWPSSAWQYSEWTFKGSFDGNGVMNYQNAVRVDYTYKDENTLESVTLYTNGTGKLVYSGAENGIYWTSNVTAYDVSISNTFFFRS